MVRPFAFRVISHVTFIITPPLLHPFVEILGALRPGEQPLCKTRDRGNTGERPGSRGAGRHRRPGDRV